MDGKKKMILQIDNIWKIIFLRARVSAEARKFNCR